MEKIKLERTKDTPLIILDKKELSIYIEGTSFPANALKIYGQVFDWIDALQIEESKVLSCSFYYNYLNSSSKSAVYEILKKFDRINKSGANIEVVWMYDELDDDLFDLGQEFSDMVQIPFKLEPQPSKY